MASEPITPEEFARRHQFRESYPPQEDYATLHAVYLREREAREKAEVALRRVWGLWDRKMYQPLPGCLDEFIDAMNTVANLIPRQGHDQAARKEGV